MLMEGSIDGPFTMNVYILMIATFKTLRNFKKGAAFPELNQFFCKSIHFCRICTGRSLLISYSKLTGCLAYILVPI
jgi:hypothetical protein